MNQDKYVFTQVAELYRNRWPIELFCKWLKQHLKITHFYGTLLNAVKDTSLCRNNHFLPCGDSATRHKLCLTTYKFLQILSVSLTSKRTCGIYSTKLIFKNDKDRSDSSEPLLFNFKFLIVHF